MKSKYFSLLYEDANLIAINKPPGVLSVPDRYDHEKRNVATEILKYCIDARPVHRLDRGTSGILIFAKHSESFRQLSLAFEHREIEKQYVAITKGVPPTEITIDKPIKRDGFSSTVKIHPQGKPSITHVKVLKSWGQFALVEAEPKTGRTHQIRVHLQSIGCPLLVDKAYGGFHHFYLSQIKKKYRIGQGQVERPLLDRVPLHAQKISIPNAAQDDKPLVIEAPLPKDMQAICYQFNKQLATT